MSQNTALQGQDVTIMCDVGDAKPPVSEYKFYLNDTALKTLKHVNHYTLTNVQRANDYGKYTCVPHNDAGDGQSAEVLLIINSK